MTTRVYGRLVDHDPRSRNFAHFAATKPLVKKSTSWKLSAPVLDQGQVGSCTGNAMAQWLNTDYAQARLKTKGFLTEDDALKIYALGTRLDGIPNNTYPGVDEGSSGIGVAKAAVKLDYIRGYDWTFTINGFLAALQTQPLIVGIAYYEGMEDPNSSGVVRPTGQLMGGHETLYHEVIYERTHAELEYENSWGGEWGLNGRARISIADFARLLVDPQMAGDVTAPRF